MIGYFIVAGERSSPLPGMYVSRPLEGMSRNEVERAIHVPQKITFTEKQIGNDEEGYEKNRNQGYTESKAGVVLWVTEQVHGVRWGEGWRQVVGITSKAYNALSPICGDPLPAYPTDIFRAEVEPFIPAY